MEPYRLIETYQRQPKIDSRVQSFTKRTKKKTIQRTPVIEGNLKAPSNKMRHQIRRLIAIHIFCVYYCWSSSVGGSGHDELWMIAIFAPNNISHSLLHSNGFKQKTNTSFPKQFCLTLFQDQKLKALDSESDLSWKSPLSIDCILLSSKINKSWKSLLKQA